MRDPGTGKVRACFDGKACAGCPHAESCPAKPLSDGRRVLRTTVHAAVLALRRRYERTKEFKKRYAERAGYLAERARKTAKAAVSARDGCVISQLLGRRHVAQWRPVRTEWTFAA
jgi:hypothetical protein